MFHHINFFLILSVETFYVVKKKVSMRLSKLNLFVAYQETMRDGRTQAGKHMGKMCLQLLSHHKHGELHIQSTIYNCPWSFLVSVRYSGHKSAEFTVFWLLFLSRGHLSGWSYTFLSTLLPGDPPHPKAISSKYA